MTIIIHRPTTLEKDFANCISFIVFLEIEASGVCLPFEKAGFIVYMDFQVALGLLD